MKEAAGVNAAPETLAALRSNARFCMEHPFEQFLIQGLVVQSFQRIHDPLLEAQEVRHATGGAFSSAGAPLNRVAAGQGIVKAYTLFRIPLASLVVTMDASGLVSCRRL